MSVMDALIKGREDARFALEGSTMTIEQKGRIHKIATMTNRELREYGEALEEWKLEIEEETERRKK